MVEYCKNPIFKILFNYKEAVYMRKKAPLFGRHRIDTYVKTLKTDVSIETRPKIVFKKNVKSQQDNAKKNVG